MKTRIGALSSTTKRSRSKMEQWRKNRSDLESNRSNPERNGAKSSSRGALEPSRGSKRASASRFHLPRHEIIFPRSEVIFFGAIWSSRADGKATSLRFAPDPGEMRRLCVELEAGPPPHFSGRPPKSTSLRRVPGRAGPVFCPTLRRPGGRPGCAAGRPCGCGAGLRRWDR